MITELKMSKHTPEPWVIGFPPPNGEQAIGDKSGLMTAIATSGYGVDTKANANRIVSCVNACAGMEDPALEIAELRKQRDELLGMIKAVTSHSVMVDINGTTCAAFPYFEYECLSSKVRGIHK